MALKTTAVARQWLSADNGGSPTGMDTTTAQKQRNGVFCAVRAEMLKAGKVRCEEREIPVEEESNTSTVTLRVVGGDKKGSLESERVKYGRESHGNQPENYCAGGGLQKL
jgi:hypothetical protein